MRRWILAATLFGMFAASHAQAGGRRTGEQGYYHSNGAPSFTGGYTTYGRKLRGGYGRNGHAPVFGPVWGPLAFTPGAGKGTDLRPNGSYVKSPYYAPDAYAEPMPADVQSKLPAQPLVDQSAVEAAPPAPKADGR